MIVKVVVRFNQSFCKLAETVGAGVGYKKVFARVLYAFTSCKITTFFVYSIYSYVNTRRNWKNSKLCENTPPFGRLVSSQFLVFPISTRVDITVYQHGKMFYISVLCIT